MQDLKGRAARAEGIKVGETEEVGAGSLDLSEVRDMVGQRIGVLGYGSIGRQVGRVAKAVSALFLGFSG